MTAKTAKQGSKGGANEFKGFFNPNIDAHIKDGVKALNLGHEATNNRIRDMAHAGLKVGISCDVAATHFTATLFDRREGSDSQGYVLSVKHANFDVVVGLLWFLVFEVYDGKGWKQWIAPDYDIEW